MMENMPFERQNYSPNNPCSKKNERPPEKHEREEKNNKKDDKIAEL